MVRPLDHATCYRIISSRDARYDGRLFVGVKSTGVYCRPVCRVRMPKATSCVFFDSAVAAHSAGFRPCLRCRPETAPALAAWNGTSTTVDRALSLIGGGALDDEPLEQLAARLGIGQRHLRRLFAEHLGTTPVAVAQMRRVLFAKKLISDTSMSMAGIAMAAGFGSVRRFNEAMQSVYQRTPTELRAKRRTDGDDPGDVVTLSLPYCGAYDWPANGQGTANCGVPGVAIASFNGPFTYDAATPGVDGTGQALLEDLNGATLAVGYNANNLSANGSLGMLLLHSHNTTATSAEVVILDRIFANGFESN